MAAPKKQTIKRTLIAEYIVKDNYGAAVRKQPGDVLDLTPLQLEAAVNAGVVYRDDDMNDEVPVRDETGAISSDESRGSGPSADSTK